MYKKYLVFISSTQEDLKAERRELAKVVTELGAIPVTMDAFDNTLEEDRRVICKAIKECDYFINLTAHKIGEKLDKSYSLELEYAYAKKADLPVLALIINDKARWKESKKEKDASAVSSLEAFKTSLKSHSNDTWSNIGELRQKALSLLSREMNLTPRRGWVPSTEAVEPSVANELSRLIRENEILKTRIKMEKPDFAVNLGEKVKQTLRVLAHNHVSLSFYYANGENWENTKTFRYLRLYRLLAPEFSTPKTALDISRFLGNILNPDLSKIIRKDFPVPSNTVKKVMADFILLKLMRFTGTETYEMTEFGNEVFAEFRLRQMLTKKHQHDNEQESV